MSVVPDTQDSHFPKGVRDQLQLCLLNRISFNILKCLSTVLIMPVLPIFTGSSHTVVGSLIVFVFDHQTKSNITIILLQVPRQCPRYAFCVSTRQDPLLKSYRLIKRYFSCVTGAEDQYCAVSLFLRFTFLIFATNSPRILEIMYHTIIIFRKNPVQCFQLHPLHSTLRHLFAKHQNFRAKTLLVTNRI
jgi:hypothetical protein